MALYDVCNAAGGMTAWGFEQDPKRLAFQLARYKFVAKALEGKQSVLEVGCSDGVGSRIVRQHVGSLLGVDVDRDAIALASKLASERWPVTFAVHDILAEPLPGHDAVYCLDLFEHIPPEREAQFLANLWVSAPVCIIGTPSKESQAYASEISKAGHVNCVTKAELRERMEDVWSTVFMFGMNDEVLHTGFDAMTHYLFGIGVRGA